MLPETKMDRVIYLAVIPLLAAIGGSVVGALMQAQSCSIVGASEIKALLQNAGLTGAQKLEFMKTYMELTDRPWYLARSLMTFITVSGSSLIGIFAVNGGFRR